MGEKIKSNVNGEDLMQKEDQVGPAPKQVVRNRKSSEEGASILGQEAVVDIVLKINKQKPDGPTNENGAGHSTIVIEKATESKDESEGVEQFGNAIGMVWDKPQRLNN
ncbi:hypothetical protein L6452_03132 [Arctium lappa]|uniref:Uncharacterized protein n=1 Tax=Arctium lappa TaxID=4217 RepID=A0ACB9FLD0_ARCLA|nr:hypothetical protein L6452_03132 [Arctium lappa]